MKIINKILKLRDRYVVKMPETCWIDVASVCNLRCRMCPQSGDFGRERGLMPYAMFCSIIDQVCEGKPLIKLYMSGEPLLHPRIDDMIRYAAQQGCRTMIHTNATKLDEAMAGRLLATPLDELSFSFDGCTAEVYESLRPPARFEEVAENIERFLRLRREAGQSTPRTTVEIISMKETEAHIPAFVARWEKSGADCVRVKPFMDWLGSVEDRAATGCRGHGFKPCYAPFHSCCFLSNGVVVPCCMDVEGKMPLGDITRKSFKEIWRGGAFGGLRNRMLRNRVQGTMCEGCHELVCKTPRERLAVLLSDLLGARGQKRQGR